MYVCVRVWVIFKRYLNQKDIIFSILRRCQIVWLLRIDYSYAVLVRKLTERYACVNLRRFRMKTRVEVVTQNDFRQLESGRQSLESQKIIS